MCVYIQLYEMLIIKEILTKALLVLFVTVFCFPLLPGRV